MHVYSPHCLEIQEQEGSESSWPRYVGYANCQRRILVGIVGAIELLVEMQKLTSISQFILQPWS